jgi:hypothetical protein
MVPLIKVQTIEEFESILLQKDFRISEAIVTQALKHLNSGKRFIPVLEVEVIDDGEIFDITLDRKYFAETLQENLKYYVEQELYEDCSKIVEAINTLKEKETHGGKSKDKHNKGVH